MNKLSFINFLINIFKDYNKLNNFYICKKYNDKLENFYNSKYKNVTFFNIIKNAELLLNELEIEKFNNIIYYKLLKIFNFI